MGRANSPLRDRVVFVEGAPRSGTTWLVTLLAAHSRLAGVEAESHLFDYGIDRVFDNFDGRTAARGLRSYVARDELADLARDFCDGVFQAMRASLGIAESTEFVVEKTPLGVRTDGLALERKLECYPDGWYVHLVRDREAVVRSLMASPLISKPTAERCGALWDQAVAEIRRTAGQSERYVEVAYERLREAPVEECARLFDWLGVETGERDLETVRVLSRERFSDRGVPVAEPPRRSARAVLARARRMGRSRSSRPPATPADAITFRFVGALRQRDVQALDALTHPQLDYVYRGADGDEVVKGDEARAALVRLAHQMFDRRHVNEWWASTGAGIAEWWTSSPGRPFCSVFFSALDGDATRVDLALGLTLEDDLIRSVLAVAAGSLAGRPVVTPRTPSP